MLLVFVFVKVMLGLRKQSPASSQIFTGWQAHLLTINHILSHDLLPTATSSHVRDRCCSGQSSSTSAPAMIANNSGPLAVRSRHI
jgi:hypothetical protein